MGLWEVFAAILALVGGIAVIAVAASRVARLRPPSPDSPSADIAARFETLEHAVQDLQQGLADTQERLDFTERLLSKAREERRTDS